MSFRGCRIRSVLLCWGFLAAALPAAAQEAPALEVSAGYSLLRVQRGFGVNLSDVKETLHGWYAEAAATQTDLLSLVGQGAGNYATVSGQKVKASRVRGRTPVQHAIGCANGVRAVSHRRGALPSPWA